MLKVSPKLSNLNLNNCIWKLHYSLPEFSKCCNYMCQARRTARSDYNKHSILTPCKIHPTARQPAARPQVGTCAARALWTDAAHPEDVPKTCRPAGGQAGGEAEQHAHEQQHARGARGMKRGFARSRPHALVANFSYSGEEKYTYIF